MSEVKEMLDTLEFGFSIEKKIHSCFKGDKIIQMFGKYQYLLKNGRGMISLIELPNYYNDGITLWEIYSMNGDLFKDVERFPTKEEAIAKAKEYLCP